SRSSTAGRTRLRLGWARSRVSSIAAISRAFWQAGAESPYRRSSAGPNLSLQVRLLRTGRVLHDGLQYERLAHSVGDPGGGEAEALHHRLPGPRHTECVLDPDRQDRNRVLLGRHGTDRIRKSAGGAVLLRRHG